MGLPKPYYEKDGITIYNADCREILPFIGEFDLCLTDPPYGIGISSNPVRQRHERKQWDRCVPDSSVFTLCRAISSFQIIWGGNYFDLPPSKGFLVWDKCQPENFSLAMVEMAWTNINTPAKLFKKPALSFEHLHPTQKCADLMGWCIGKAPKADTILDPFMGSGTTLVAAKQLGRRAVGIEIEEKYCEIAVQRLAQQVMDFGGE